MNQNIPKMHRRHQGSTLMEILVAVFVLSVGLLGTASMQVTSKRTHMEARERSLAAALAQDLVERLRANATALGTYTNAGAGRTLTGTTMTQVACTTDCTAAQLAQHDLYEWEQALAGVAEKVGTTNVGGFTSPTACVQGPDGGSAVYTVTIAWRGRTRLSAPTTSTCGTGTGLYDSSDGLATDVHRRVLVLDTYITDLI